jgi:hypothetical protein
MLGHKHRVSDGAYLFHDIFDRFPGPEMWKFHQDVNDDISQALVGFVSVSEDVADGLCKLLSLQKICAVSVKSSIQSCWSSSTPKRSAVA